MDLTSLSNIFKDQARNGGNVTLSENTFQLARITISNQFDQLLQGAFQLKENLKIQVSPDQIFISNNNELFFTGVTSVLNLTGINVQVSISISNNNQLSVILKIPLPEQWKFSDSFTYLTDRRFNLLSFNTPYFIFSNLNITSYQWENETISLSSGLNFASKLKLDGLSPILQVLTDLIDKNKHYVFWGSISPEKINLNTTNTEEIVLYPPATIKAPLSESNLKIGSNFSLDVSHPSLVLEITDDFAFQQTLWLFFEFKLIIKRADSDASFIFQSPLFGDDNTLEFSIIPDPCQVVSFEDLIPIVAGENINSYIPSELKSVFSHFGFKGFTASLNPQTAKIISVGVALGTVESWTFFENFKLDDLTLQFSVLDPTGQKLKFTYFNATLEFFPKIFKGKFEIEVSTDMIINGRFIGDVNLNDLIKGISNNPIEIPEEVESITFSDFGVSFEKVDQGYDYSLFGQSDITFDLDIFVSKVETNFQVIIESQENQKTYQLIGRLAIGNSYFNATLDLNDGNKKLSASWNAINQNYLEFNDFVQALGFDALDIPEGLDFGLESASFTYNFTEKIFILEAKSVNYGTVIFVGLKSQQQESIYIFGLNLSSQINLSNLPLVGKQFPPEQTISIDDLQFLIVSQNLKTEEVNNFNNLLPENITKIPLQSQPTTQDKPAINKGLNVSAILNFGDTTETLALPIASDNSATTADTSENPQPAPITTETDNTQWYPIKKAFGILYFARVGIQYQKEILWFLLDASISSTGLTLTLDGLSVGSPISKFEPKFNLKGIGISYESKGNVAIAGAFLRSTINGKDEYSGALIIKTQAFTLSAIGSYTTTDDGHPSLFIYGILDKPIGGPPFFFVTALALGFGYNRSFILPKLEEIPNFPLVKAALNSSKADLVGLTQIQRELTPYIPPKTGSIFLAIGIKFTSFKIIDSFALLVATFGDQFTLNLIGISTLTSPPILDEKQTFYLAKVRFALLARFVPAEGTLKVDGKILPDSYIFDTKCIISGGFAFYSWFKGDSQKGIPEGDFVLTVGGYHPRFNIPAHYPRVDPLALNWQINSELSIKGSVYFALTASAIMAGGRLESVWQSGNLRAWFIANAHFIVAWQPYFYDAEISLRMGASYTFNVFGWRKTISVDVGASLHIWGPEFSGTATIDLKIISFTIAFGSRTRKLPKPISWQQFKDSFLPDDNQICTLAIESGLLRKVENEDIFIVNPKEFVINTSSVIPLKNSNTGKGENKETFGIAPMGVDSSKFTQSDYNISIKKDNKDENETFSFEPIYKNIPAGLWGESIQVNLNGELIENVLSGFKIKPANPPKPGKTQAIERKNLAYDIELVNDAYQWGSFISLSESDEADENIRQENIGKNITSEDVTKIRNSLLQNLGLSTSDIDLEDFTTDKGKEQAFIISPCLQF